MECKAFNKCKTIPLLLLFYNIIIIKKAITGKRINNNSDKTQFKRKLRGERTQVMLATIQSRTFCLLACCLKT
jgi:hypothetical protein